MSSIFFQEKGKGFPVVLIHGFCETSEIWDGIITALSTFFRVVTLDLSGFGKSPLPELPFSIADIGKQVIQQLEDAGIEDCVVIGHSLGGYVTLAMVEMKPQMMKAFGLFHSTAYADTEEKKENRNRVIKFVQKNGVATYIESFIPSLFANPDHPGIRGVVNLGSKTQQTTLIAYTEAMRDRPDSTGVLRNYRRPILFLGGEKDGVIPVQTLREQAQLARKNYLYILKDVAHMGMLENEKETVQIVRQFVLDAVSQRA